MGLINSLLNNGATFYTNSSRLTRLKAGTGRKKGSDKPATAVFPFLHGQENHQQIHSAQEQ